MTAYYIKMCAYPEEVTDLSWVYRQIESLPTPCGKIVVMDEAGTLCKFSVRKNPYSPDYHLFYGTPQEIAFNTDTNYLLCVSVESLKIGHTYKICLLGAPLQYGDSDEHTQAVSGTVNGHSIAIGAYDPNDEEKEKQAYQYSAAIGSLAQKMIIDPPQYDESHFVQYDVEMLEDFSGFSFRPLDRSIEEIVFPVAWVKNEYPSRLEYEGAVELWTT